MPNIWMYAAGLAGLGLVLALLATNRAEYARAQQSIAMLEAENERAKVQLRQYKFAVTEEQARYAQAEKQRKQALDTIAQIETADLGDCADEEIDPALSRILDGLRGNLADPAGVAGSAEGNSDAVRDQRAASPDLP